MQKIAHTCELPGYHGPPPDKYEMQQIFDSLIYNGSSGLLLNSWTDLIIIRHDVTYHVRPGMRMDGVVACCSRHRIAGADDEPCVGIHPDALPRVCWDQKGSIVPPAPTPEYGELFGPARLAFDPIELCVTDDGSNDEGVPWRDIWNDPLARSIWLVIGSHYLKSQYFRKQCLAATEWIREHPPIVANDIQMFSDFGASHIEPKAKLYPYVVRCLMDEKRWPYLSPPAALVAPGPTPWVYVPKENA